MKKFCSKCGNQLDLGKKACTTCQAFNPYFISGFTNTESTSKIELQDELFIAKEQAIANEEALRAGQLEREKSEENIKAELLRVKEETEQYKKETLNLVAGVQKELHDMDRQNKLLKETVQSLKNERQVNEPDTITPTYAPELKSAEPRSSATYVIVAAVVLGISVLGFSYFYFSKSLTKTSSNVVNTQALVVTQPAAAQANSKSVHDAAPDTTTKHVWLAAVTPSPRPNNVGFTLTANRVIGDLVGKKLSGCDITINKPSEISHIDNLVLVEKLSASYFKYKCTVKVKQGSETYTASPYIYYSSEGSFIKVDGTNCE